MAKAVISLQKESGGIVKISPVDGVGITEVTVPESGELVTKEYTDVQVSSQLSQKADLSGAAFTGTVDVRAPLYLNPSLGTLTFASDTDNRIITQYQNGSTINWWQSLQASGDLQLYSPNNKKFVIYGSTATYVGINTSNPQSALDVNGTITATTYALSTNWKVNESGGVLFFEYNGVKKMKLDSSGNLTVTGDITAFGGV